MDVSLFYHNFILHIIIHEYLHNYRIYLHHFFMAQIRLHRKYKYKKYNV